MTRVRSAAELACNELLGDSSISGVFDQMEWAENEIAEAMERHPEKSSQLYHSFEILVPLMPMGPAEFVYRAHCRELVDRIVKGEDTRPPTDAEMVLALMEISFRAPMTTSATTLYMRIFQRAFPEKEIFGVHVEHYEHVGGEGANHHERELIRKLTQPGRVIKGKPCDGKHWGEPAPDCVYIVDPS